VIGEALTIIKDDLQRYLKLHWATPDEDVFIGNIAYNETVTQYKPDVSNKVVITLLKVEEEKTLKNTPAHSKDPASNQIIYHNPPVYLNLYVLFSINSTEYANALIYLSHVVRFFQRKKIFTHLNTPVTNGNQTFDNFKFILDLYSPTFEELNHIWSIMGGKQLPHVMYKLRLVELQLIEPQAIEGIIETIDIQY